MRKTLIFCPIFGRNRKGGPLEEKINEKIDRLIF